MSGGKKAVGYFGRSKKKRKHKKNKNINKKLNTKKRKEKILFASTTSQLYNCHASVTLVYMFNITMKGLYCASPQRDQPPLRNTIHALAIRHRGCAS